MSRNEIIRDVLIIALVVIALCAIQGLPVA